MENLKRSAIPSLFFLILGASGCGDRGTLSVSLTDAPRDDFEALTVNLKEVQVVGEGDSEAGAVSLLTFEDGAKSLNLLDLEGTSELLGSAKIPAGTYTQIRLIVHETGNSATPIDGEPAEMRIASGTTTGAKLTGAQIVITEGATTELTLDWDLDGADSTQVHLKNDGTYLMTPVLKVVE